jgi:hypothetical protein
MNTKTVTLPRPLVRFLADDDGDITVYPPVHNHVPSNYHKRQPPKDNQGRTNCFWCDMPTKKRGFWKEYDVCPICDK